MHLAERRELGKIRRVNFGLSQPSNQASLSKWERAVAGIAIFLLIALKFLYLRSLRVGSDESQHLHVVWGWTQGMVQYRDFFDNHTPLFHMLYSPLLAWLGERSDIILWMRVAVLPLYFGSLWCVYWLASRLYSRRIGIWAAIFVGLNSKFMLTATEFRTDDLWVLAWIATLAIALTKTPLTVRRSFTAGVMLGAAFSVSLKTTLLLAALLIAIVAALVIRIRKEGPGKSWNLWSNSLAALAGLLIIPLALVAYFAEQHALQQLYYCVVLHNTLPGLGHWSHNSFSFRPFIFPILLPLTVWCGMRMIRSGEDSALATRRAIVLMTAGLFLGLLESYWPLVTSQDFLPVIPLIVVSITPILMEGISYLAQWRDSTNEKSRSMRRAVPWVALLLPGLIAYAEIKVTTHGFGPFNFYKIKRFEKHLDRVLRMTRPDDYVMDDKGETIFRRRPFYFALENVTQKRLKMGLMKNTIPSDIIRTGVCVVSDEYKRLPEPTLKWVKGHYLPLAEYVFVAGSMLDQTDSKDERAFEITVPAYYTVISPEGPAQGILDGNQCVGQVYLNAGKHVFSTSAKGPPRRSLVSKCGGGLFSVP